VNVVEQEDEKPHQLANNPGSRWDVEEDAGPNVAWWVLEDPASTVVCGEVEFGQKASTAKVASGLTRRDGELNGTTAWVSINPAKQPPWIEETYSGRRLSIWNGLVNATSAWMTYSAAISRTCQPGRHQQDRPH